MNETEKKTSIYAFQQCSLTSADTCPTSTSKMTMNWSINTVPRIEAELDPRLAPFFSNLPSEYWHYVSGTDLGDNSYTYEKDALFNTLLMNGLTCPKCKVRRQLMPSDASDLRTRAVIKSFKLFQKVYDISMDDATSKADALEQVELMECAYYYRKFQHIDHLSPSFLKNFGLPSTTTTTCAHRLSQLRTGAKEIRMDEWESVFDEYLQTP